MGPAMGRCGRCRLSRLLPAVIGLCLASILLVVTVGRWSSRQARDTIPVHHLIETLEDCASRGGEKESFQICGGVHYCCGVCTGTRICDGVDDTEAKHCACIRERDESGQQFFHPPEVSESRWTPPPNESRPQITDNFECGVAGGDRFTYNYCGGVHYCCEACSGQFECKSNGGWNLLDCACTEPVHLCGPGASVRWISKTTWECKCAAGTVAWDSMDGHPNRTTDRNCHDMVDDKDECCAAPRCRFSNVEKVPSSGLVTQFLSDDAPGCTCRDEEEVREQIHTPLSQRTRTDFLWSKIPADIETVSGGEGEGALANLCHGYVPALGVLPHRVFYTAKTDPDLRSLTEGSNFWPDDYKFHYYNDVQLETSMVQVSRLLTDAGVPNAYRAFRAIRPWAFRADIWRLGILWACGGIYIDAKLRLIGNVSTIFPVPRNHARGSKPLLLVGDDIPQSYLQGAGYWNGVLAATPRHPEMLEALKLSIRNIEQRAYYRFDKGGLNLTGPGMLHNSIKARRGCADCVQVVFELEETWPNDIKHNRLLRKGDKAPLFRIDIPLHNSGKSDYWGDDKQCKIYCSLREPCLPSKLVT